MWGCVHHHNSIYQTRCTFFNLCKCVRGKWLQIDTGGCKRLVTASTACVCLWYSKCAYMCDIHHHLQRCVWKAGLVVVVLHAISLLSHVQASPALTRLQLQDAERLWMSIHKFTGEFWYSEAKNFSLSFHLCLSLSQLHLSSFSACLSKPDYYFSAKYFYWINSKLH